MEAEDKPKTAMKMIVLPSEKEKVIGIHVIGMGADEMMQVKTLFFPFFFSNIFPFFSSFLSNIFPSYLVLLLLLLLLS